MLSKIIKYVSFISFLLFFPTQLNAQKSITGVVTEEISTKDGKFLLHRTTHLPKGKTISGTVTTEPESDKTKKREKQVESLKHYILKIGDQIISNNGIFTINLPDVDNIPLQIFTSEGKLVQEIPFELSEPFIPKNLKMPKTIRKDFAEKITGDFSGDISNANILLNEKPVDILAGNDTELFFKVEDIEPGKQDLSLEYDNINATESVNVIDYTLQAGRLNLNHGESTYLDIKVVGLEDLQEPLELKVQNQSVGTIRLEGGDIQTIQITPSEVAETGIWQKRFDIQSLTRGSFNIYTELEKPNEDQDQLNPINEFPEETLAKKGDSIPAPDALNPSGPNSNEHPTTTKPPAKADIPAPDALNPIDPSGDELPVKPQVKDAIEGIGAPDEMNPAGPTADELPSTTSPPVKVDIPAPDEINPTGMNANEMPQTVIIKKGNGKKNSKKFIEIDESPKLMKPQATVVKPPVKKDINPCKGADCEVVKSIRIFNNKTGEEITDNSIQWGVVLRAELPEIMNSCDPDCSPEVRVEMRRIPHCLYADEGSLGRDQPIITRIQSPGDIVFEAVYECYCDGELIKTETLTRTLQLVETNNCCDRIRQHGTSGISENLRFNLENRDYVEIWRNKIDIFISGIGLKTYRFDFHLESVFCNLENNAVYAEVRRLMEESASFSSSGSASISLSHPTDSEGRDPIYHLSFLQSVSVNGEIKELAVYLNIDRATCEYSVQVIFDGEYYSNNPNPIYSIFAFIPQLGQFHDPEKSYYWKRLLFLWAEHYKYGNSHDLNHSSQSIIDKIKVGIERLMQQGKINKSEHDVFISQLESNENIPFLLFELAEKFKDN